MGCSAGGLNDLGWGGWGRRLQAVERAPQKSTAATVGLGRWTVNGFQRLQTFSAATGAACGRPSTATDERQLFGTPMRACALASDIPDSFAFVVPLGAGLVAAQVQMSDGVGDVGAAPWRLDAGSLNWTGGPFKEGRPSTRCPPASAHSQPAAWQQAATKSARRDQRNRCRFRVGLMSPRGQGPVTLTGHVPRCLHGPG